MIEPFFVTIKLRGDKHMDRPFIYYLFFLNFFFQNLFIYFWDRERQSMNGGGAERDGDTESETGSRLWAISPEPDAGLELTSCEIMTWAEVGRSTDWATQAPPFIYFSETERDRAWAGEGQSERETQILTQAPGSELSAQNPMWGSNPRTMRSWPDRTAVS